MIASRHLRILHDHAGRLRARSGLPPSVLDGELLSDGALGLLDAIEKFNPQRGVKFRTYAGRRVVGAMLDGLRERDWATRAMRSQGEDAPHQDSLHRAVFRGDGGREVKLVTVLEAEPRSDVEAGVQRDAVRRMAALLGDRDSRMAIELYYADGLTLKEIGGAIGISESRVSQIHSAAIKTLRARVIEPTTDF